jgi:pilus assembly protein FimV
MTLVRVVGLRGWSDDARLDGFISPKREKYEAGVRNPMAFGFGFNKQKVLSAAEKFVQQGKLQNAISEYEKILKHDAKDLTVMNTIGDLYARIGEHDKAAESFKSVGDAYASQGFTVKAIAMYKKLSKLKSSMECVLRLAELYTQQGLFNDARAQYLQVAEDFLKSDQLDQAVRIFEKTLEMDPENVAMRSKLAEVYIRLGKKDDAWKLLSAAAESLRAKGQLAAADEIVQRMLKLDPSSGYALELRGRAALDSGDSTAAIESLSKVPDLDTNPEGLRVLFQAYLRGKRFQEAGGLATKLATLHNDNVAITEYANALFEAEQYREVLKVYEEHADELLRDDPAKFSESLRAIIGHVQDDTQALEVVLALFQKSGENTHLSEIYELLAHAYVQSGELEKAGAFYHKLMQMEPANQMHAQNYQQVLNKMGKAEGPRPITAEEGAVMVDELEATAPFIEQHYNDELALLVRSALTDAELFISYNMAPKALAPLQNALPKAPRDLRLNQKLAALHTRAGRFAEAAVCCRTLEGVYREAGHPEEASRYGELAAKYEERGGVVPPKQAEAPVAEPAATAEFATAAPPAGEFEIAAPTAQALSEGAEEVASAQPAAAHKPAAASGLFFHASRTPAKKETEKPVAQEAQLPATVQPEQSAEGDLSGDWESDFSVEAPQVEEPQGAETVVAETAPHEIRAAEPQALQPPSAVLEEGIEEVRFYLGQGMTDHAERVLAKLEALAQGSPELAVLRLGIESAKQPSGVQLRESEVSVEEAAPESHALEQTPAPPSSTPQPWPQAAPPQTPPERPVLEEIVSDLEQSLGDGFGSQDPATKPQATPLAQASMPAATPGQSFRTGTLDEFVADLEASLGSDFTPEAAVAQVAPPLAQATPLVAAPPMQPVEAPALAQAPVARAAAAAAMPTVSAPVPPPMPVQPPAVSATPASVSHGIESTPGVDLANMFGELKHELEEDVASTDEDPETHYNLGVAFREMGLLDEAIGEFQKVCQAMERGRAFPQIMQTYTWLAQCFLEKGIPEAAIRWYERALALPSIDQETRSALHYELAASFESAGNKSAALSNFLEVYGRNIDYRDVAERIKALRP